MFFWFELGLSLLSIAAGYAFPSLGSSWFERAERQFNRLAQRRGLSVVVVGLTALAARAALLPILPIPQPAGDDEFSYLLLADTFAHGRLTNPTHPMWIHFESFHIIWQPTYTGIFHPAQGLVMALGQVITGRPFWGVWLSVGVMCAALCWMLQGWLPPGWALLGGFLAVIRLGTFSYWANSYWGGAVAATGGALVLGALPRLKHSQRMREALLMGLGFAILANSRPYEGVLLGLPVAGVLTLWALGRKRLPLGTGAELHPEPISKGEEIRGWGKRVVAPLLLVFLVTACAMAYYSWRTTGSPWDTPYLVNARTYGPVYFPWQVARPLPSYHHAVLERWYVAVRDAGRRTAAGWVVAEINVLLTPVVFFLGPVLGLPLLLLGLTLPYGLSWKNLSADTRFLLLVCGLVLAGSMLPVLRFLPHYAAPIAGAVWALALEALRRLRRRQWHGKPTGLLITRLVPVICLLMLALRISAKPLGIAEPRRWLNGSALASWCSLGPTNLERAAVLAQLERLPGRHLAIVRYGPHHPIDLHEWVYNEADIDAAKVIWARDMGAAENEELINYFRDRHIWLIEPDDVPPRLLPYSVPPPPQADSAPSVQRSGEPIVFLMCWRSPDAGDTRSVE